MKVKKGDTVEVIAGKDAGRRGKVLKVDSSRERVVVEGVHMIKRHTKARAAGQEGQIIEKEAPIHVSNLMLVCPKCTNTARVANKTLDDGSKVRICKKCSESVEPSKKK